MPNLPAPVAIVTIISSSAFPLALIYPMNLLRTRFQASTSKERLRILPCLADIYRADGAVGFYRGFLTSLSKTLPSVTISYLTYEFMAQLLGLPTLGAK